MVTCKHRKRIGDNYGISCQECGQALEGYGGWFGSKLKGNEKCIHVWTKISSAEEECMYCHTTREREKKAN
jgi:hypothetical protein